MAQKDAFPHRDSVLTFSGGGEPFLIELRSPTPFFAASPCRKHTLSFYDKSTFPLFVQSLSW
eukprot:COSAG06_NODE_1815_length_8303_cov_3.031936_10_plen_62_part_00